MADSPIKLEDVIKIQAEQIEELKSKIVTIEAKLQATSDYTDDLISVSNNAVSHSDTIASQAGIVMAHADSTVTLYLTIASFTVAIIAGAITYHFNRTQEQHVKEITQKLLDDLAENDDFRSDFVKQLVLHSNVKERIDSVLENIYKEQSNKIKDSLKQFADSIGG